ncbi:MAG TPA: MFS transporter [Gaiellaceae bacterium]|nr:MFS transporter [Gaiellaceae bacterium]
MRRLLLLVGAIVFVDTMFFAALTPLLPEYAEEHGLSKAGAGFLSAAYPIGALIGGVPGGLVAARYGVKPTVLAGLAGMAVTTLTFGLANDIVLLDTARVLQGVASAFSWTAALTWIVAAAPPDRRGETIGAAMGAAIFGALFGPVVGAVASYVGTELAFGSVAVFAAALGVWALRTPAFVPSNPQPISRLFRAAVDRRVIGPVWFVVVPALLFGVLNVLAPLRLSELGLTTLAIGAVWLVGALFEALIAPAVGRYSDRRGRLVPLRAGLLAAAAATATLPWIGHGWLLAGFVIATACAAGAFWSPAMSLLADRAEETGLDYAYGFALINLAWAPGAAGGAAVGGAVARATADAVPYLALSALCVLTLAALWRSASSS